MKLFLDGEKKSARPERPSSSEIFRAYLEALDRRIPWGRAALLAVAVAALILDKITTWIALSRPGFMEGRPLQGILIATFGLPGGLALALAIMVPLCILFFQASRSRGLPGAFGLYGMGMIALLTLQAAAGNLLLLSVY